MNGESVQGSCDFFYQASDLLTESDTPHILLAGLSGHSFKLKSWNVTRESLPWFKAEMLDFLEQLERELPE
jgi:hypothetical protein